MSFNYLNIHFFFNRQVDDESYSWGQKSLGKDYYKDDMNPSQYVSVLSILSQCMMSNFK